MAPVKSRAGERHGKLLVLDEYRVEPGRAYWLCRCDCGKEAWVAGNHLGKRTVSCGCWRADPTVRQAAAAKVPEAVRKARSAAGGRVLGAYKGFGAVPLKERKAAAKKAAAARWSKKP